MTWLCVALRRIFWMILILIQILKILYQEIREGGFLQDIEALYFYLR